MLRKILWTELLLNADGAAAGATDAAASAAAIASEASAAAAADNNAQATLLYGEKPADGAAKDEPPKDGAAAKDGDKPADAKADDKKDGDKKPDEAAAAAELAKVPDDGKYAFTLKEGLELDAALAEKAMPVLKEAGITRAQANSLAGFLAEQREAEAQAVADNWEKTNREWQEAARTDKEYGGDKFGASLSRAQIALNKFGTPELNEYLTLSGGGNHPELIRFMARVGNAFSDDKPVGSETPAAPMDAATALYGKN